MYFLGMELVGLVSLDELGGVLKRGGPVKATTECLADESAGGGLMAALPSVNIGKLFLPLFCGDAP